MAKVMLNSKEFCRAINFRTTKYGMSADNILGNVDENGVLTASSKIECSIDLTGVKEVGARALQFAFYNKDTAVAFKAPDLEKVSANGCHNAFCGNRIAGVIDLNKLTTIEKFGCFGMFDSNKTITGFDLSSLKTVGSYGAYGMFKGCSAIAGSFVFDSLVKVEEEGLAGMLLNYEKTVSGLIESVSFPQLTDIVETSFGSNEYGWIFYGREDMKEIHFRSDMQEKIEAMEGYAEQWGATNATIYFDL